MFNSDGSLKKNASLPNKLHSSKARSYFRDFALALDYCNYFNSLIFLYGIKIYSQTPKLKKKKYI